MHVILCLDNNNGMLFNHRRQSRDRAVVEDILNSLQGKRLWVRPYSASLFQGRKMPLLVDDAPWKHALPGDACFVEDTPLSLYTGKIESLTFYRWNRRYPGDLFLDVDLSAGWRLVSQREFPGYSHQKITKEVYHL